MKSRTVEVKTKRGMIQVTYGPLEVADVREHSFRKDVAQAELRQTVTKHFPSARANNSITDALYGMDEYNFESKDYENVRIAWINIPLGKTKQDVEKQLEKFTEATIYRIIANDCRMVLSQEQLHAIQSPEFEYTLPQAEKTHIVMKIRDDGQPVAVSSVGDELTGAVELDENGKVENILEYEGVQFQSKGFALSHTPDVDLRPEAIVETTPASSEVLDEAKTPAL